MSKKNLILLIIVIAGVVIYLATNKSLRTYSTENKAEYSKIFPKFDPENVDKIIIKKFMNTTTIEKQDSGWFVVDSAMTVRADSGNVKSLLKDLGNIEILSLRSQSKKSHFKMKVDTLQGARITLLSGKDTLCDIIIGGMSGFGLTYVRKPDSDNVYEAKGFLTRYSSITDWRDKTIVSVEPESVKSFSFRFPEGGYKLERTDSGWIATDLKSGETVRADSTKVIAVLRSLSRFMAPTFPRLPDDTAGIDFSKPDYEAKILLNDGSEKNFAAYQTKKNDNVFVLKSSERKVLLRVYKGTMRRFERQSIDQFKSGADTPPSPPQINVKSSGPVVVPKGKK